MHNQLCRFSDNGRTESGGKAEEPAEAGEDPPLERSVHRRPKPARTAAHAGQLWERKPDKTINSHSHVCFFGC